MTATRWWSRSKGEWLVIEEMVDRYLLNCHAMFERGQYLVPDDPDDPLATRAPSAGEAQHLRAAFDAEMKRRAIGPWGPPETA